MLDFQLTYSKPPPTSLIALEPPPNRSLPPPALHTLSNRLTSLPHKPPPPRSKSPPRGTARARPTKSKKCAQRSLRGRQQRTPRGQQAQFQNPPASTATPRAGRSRQASRSSAPKDSLHRNHRRHAPRRLARRPRSAAPRRSE